MFNKKRIDRLAGELGLCWNHSTQTYRQGHLESNSVTAYSVGEIEKKLDLVIEHFGLEYTPEETVYKDAKIKSTAKKPVMKRKYVKSGKLEKDAPYGYKKNGTPKKKPGAKKK